MGRHDESCERIKPGCQCLSCARDDGEFNCCEEHKFECGQEYLCPDYEEETDDAGA